MTSADCNPNRTCVAGHCSGASAFDGSVPMESLAPFDFSGDGRSDILWHNATTGATRVWYMGGTSRLGIADLDASFNMPDDTGWKMVDVADFNQDGKADILRHDGVTGATEMWLMDDRTHFHVVAFDSSLNSPAAGGWRIVGTGDFNQDGKVDILWKNATPGRIQVWYMDGTTRTQSQDFDAGLNVDDVTAWSLVGVADFDQDGMVDILGYNSISGQIQVWYMNGIVRRGFEYFDAKLDLPASAGWRIVGTADVNADGRPDLVWHNGASGATRVWYLNGRELTGSIDLDPMLDLADSSGWSVVRW